MQRGSTDDDDAWIDVATLAQRRASSYWSAHRVMQRWERQRWPRVRRVSRACGGFLLQVFVTDYEALCRGDGPPPEARG